MTPDRPEPLDGVHAAPTTPDLRSEMMKGALALAAAPLADHGGVRVIVPVPVVVLTFPSDPPAVGLLPGYHL